MEVATKVCFLLNHETKACHRNYRVSLVFFIHYGIDKVKVRITSQIKTIHPRVPKT